MGKLVQKLAIISMILSCIGALILAWTLSHDSFGELHPLIFFLLLVAFEFAAIFVNLLICAFGDFIDDVSIIRHKVELFAEKEGINKLEETLKAKENDDLYKNNPELAKAEELAKKSEKLHWYE